MGDDFITGGEFGRFRADHTAWRIEITKQIGDGFAGVCKRLDDMNGRGRETAAKVDMVEAEVSRLAEHGCAQYETHRDTLQALVAPKLERVERAMPWAEWHPAVKVGAGVGGLTVFAALLELAGRVLAHFGI